MKMFKITITGLALFMGIGAIATSTEARTIGPLTPTEICNNYDALRAKAGRGAILVTRGAEVISLLRLHQLRAAWAKAGKPHANILWASRSYMPGGPAIISIPRDVLGTKLCVQLVRDEAHWVPNRQLDPGVKYSDDAGLMLDPHAADHF